jgi:hypothetical protein
MWRRADNESKKLRKSRSGAWGARGIRGGRREGDAHGGARDARGRHGLSASATPPYWAMDPVEPRSCPMQNKPTYNKRVPGLAIGDPVKVRWPTCPPNNCARQATRTRATNHLSNCGPTQRCPCARRATVPQFMELPDTDPWRHIGAETNIRAPHRPLRPWHLQQSAGMRLQGANAGALTRSTEPTHANVNGQSIQLCRRPIRATYAHNRWACASTLTPRPPRLLTA